MKSRTSPGDSRSPRKVIKPGKFSQVIAGEISAKDLSTSSTVSSYQILHPQDRCQPRITPSSFSARQRESAEDSSSAGSVASVSQRLAAVKPFPSEASPDDKASDFPRRRLEAELIEKMKFLNKRRVDAENSQRLYRATAKHMQAKLASNHQQAQEVIDSVQSVRKNLESIRRTG
eukprot:gene4845-5313_t